MKFVFLMLFFFLDSYASGETSVCDSPATLDQIENLSKKPENSLVDKTLAQALKNSPLVLAGETHFYTSTSSMKDLIVRFQRVKGAKACVAFEFPNVTNSADLYVDKYVNDIKNEINKVDPKDSIKVAMIPGVTDEYKRFQNYFKPLTSLASSLQMKNFCVDSAKKYTEEVSWVQRNASIAKNLASLLNSGVCSSVLMFIGKEHLNNDENSLKFFLSTFFQNYSFVTLNLQMTKETIGPGGRTWNMCNPPSISSPILFKSALVNSNFKIVPAVSSSSVSFHDFIYTLLLP